MEIRPIKENNETLYPTIKEVPKTSHMKEIILAASIFPNEMLPVAVPCYVAVVSTMVIPITICKLIRIISLIVTILSSILLLINKKKTTNNIMDNENLSKLNKHRKIKLWIFSISIAIIVITSLVIVYLENHM